MYLTSSSYSGSTLFTFLVNQHPELFTIGELEGWDYGDSQYHCSCGTLIDECVFFQYIRENYRKKGLAFSTRNFGTRLRLAGNSRINRYLTCAIPYLRYTEIEKMRDTVLWHLPGLKKRYNNAVDSNRIFVNSSLEYSHASVFVDATKNPFRLRMLSNINEFDLKILYMARDIRGVVASNVRKKNVSVEAAAKQWLAEQENILRVLREYPGYMSIYYEDLCTHTNAELSKLYAHLGVQDYSFEGNIREGEHHILGNVMRVSDVNDIRLDERSKTELSKGQIALIEEIAWHYLETCDNQDVYKVVSHYLDDTKFKRCEKNG